MKVSFDVFFKSSGSGILSKCTRNSIVILFLGKTCFSRPKIHSTTAVTGGLISMLEGGAVGLRILAKYEGEVFYTSKHNI